MFEILLHKIVKMKNVACIKNKIICDEIIESYNEKTKFNKQSNI